MENFTADSSGYAPTETLTYDNNGNLLYDGTQAYTYDAWNRLITVAHAYRDSGGTLQTGHVFDTMTYDATGRRIVKAISGTGLMDFTYHDYYSGQSLIEERNGSNVSVKQYVWGLGYVDELVQQSVNFSPWANNDCNTAYWACQDANYNVLGMVDSYGILRERYEYTAYGQRQVFTSTGANDPGCYKPSPNSQYLLTGGDAIADGPYGSYEVSGTAFLPQLFDFGHQGLRHDEESGNIYNRARMLQPGLGKFMQNDPFEYINGSNKYTCTISNSITIMDPFGTDIYLINNPLSAGGSGHNGIIVSNGNGGYSYYSYGPQNDGTSGGSSSGGNSSGTGNGPGLLTAVSFPTLADAEAFARAHGFTRQEKWKTNADQDSAARAAARPWAGSDYDLTHHNCQNFAQSLLNAAGTNAEDFGQIPNLNYTHNTKLADSAGGL